MSFEFEIPLVDVNDENAQTRIDNKRDEHGHVIPHRPDVTGSDRKGAAVRGFMGPIVHGFGSTTDKTPYTLVIFEWFCSKPGHGLRFKEAIIEVSFEAKGTRRKAQSQFEMAQRNGGRLADWDPEVVAVAPRGTTYHHPTAHHVTEKRSFEISLKAKYEPFFSAGPKFTWEKTDDAKRADAVQVIGEPAFLGKSRAIANGVRFKFFENSSQGTGVPSYVRTAVLLKRRRNDNGKFVGKVNTEFKVSVVEDAKGAVKDVIRRLLGRRDQPIEFDPDVATDGGPCGKNELGSMKMKIQEEFDLVSIGAPEPEVSTHSSCGEVPTEGEDPPKGEDVKTGMQVAIVVGTDDEGGDEA
ncbi:hypothetical protein ACMFMG_010441 [Clarireedia jacksonii]